VVDIDEARFREPGHQKTSGGKKERIEGVQAGGPRHEISQSEGGGGAQGDLKTDTGNRRRNSNEGRSNPVRKYQNGRSPEFNNQNKNKGEGINKVKITTKRGNKSKKKTTAHLLAKKTTVEQKTTDQPG